MIDRCPFCQWARPYHAPACVRGEIEAGHREARELQRLVARRRRRARREARGAWWHQVRVNLPDWIATGICYALVYGGAFGVSVAWWAGVWLAARALVSTP